MSASNIIAALYSRVSDKSKQGENFSISTQLEEMREWTVSEGWTVGYELSEKQSAYLEGLTRSELNKVLELARLGKINILVFFSPDRFTRDMADGVILRRELKRYNVRLFCYHPTPHEITSDTEVLNILTDWQSQMFVERNREASMRGLLGKVEMGLYSQGTPPYGYRLEGKKKDTIISIFEEEAHWVRKIFHWYYYEEIGSSEIARRLNEQHAPLPQSTIGSREWTNRLVRHILGNESYAGVWYAFRWAKVGKAKFVQRPRSEWKPVPIPSIVARAIWDGVQRKLASRHLGRETKWRYLLSSRISCICGTAVRGSHNRSWYVKKNGERKEYNWYRCCSHERVKGFCGLPHFPAELVDEIVWNFSYHLIRNPEKLLKGYRDLQEECSEEAKRLARQIDTLDQQIAEQKKELADLQDQRTRTQSKTVRAMLDEQIEKLGLAIDELEERLVTFQEEALTQPYTDQHITESIADLHELRKMYEALETINEEADFEAKRALINILNLNVTLYTKENGEKWIDIHWLRNVYPQLVDSAENNKATRQSQAAMLVSMCCGG